MRVDLSLHRKMESNLSVPIIGAGMRIATVSTSQCGLARLLEIMFRSKLSTTWHLLLGHCVLFGASSLIAAKLPDGFVETRIAGGLNPTTMTFAPDGRLFLCEKQGLLRVVAEGKLLDPPALDLTRVVDGWNERGLLSICFDPEFSRNGWF